MRARSAVLAVTALGAGAVVVGGGTAGEASAAPGYTPVETCQMTFFNPNTSPLPLQANSVLRVAANGGGQVTVSIVTDAVSFLGYDQDVSFTWANLDTGRNGGAQASKRVVGPETTYRFPTMTTDVGRITFQASASNTSSLDSNRITTGQCGLEMKSFD